MRIELPKDNWAELREPEEVSERGRRPILSALTRITPAGWASLKKLDPEELKRAIAEDDPGFEIAEKVSQMGGADLAAFQEANDYCIVALVSKWSYSQPITLEGALDLPVAAYDQLREATGPAIHSLFVDFTPQIKEDKIDPDSPFVPSSESNGHSTVEPEIINSPSLPSGEPINLSANSG